ncbi:WD repeat-containing protein 20 [Nilaparvata lugens]|uniref:WD repeat-containing protein 20 n=1 Tax=Nilaparvata lugens TaxID=108931 RepID=UPI00193DECC8|nr:WD repeat-containing protein 20 [Nilaparvata lugens]
MAADLPKPIEKKMYKGTYPTCHDFNVKTMSPDSVSLLIGFSTGQVQLIDLVKKDVSKLYNEERLIDKTKVTCMRWVPGSPNSFVVSHSSGQLYVYNEESPCGTSTPHYQPFKQGDGYTVHTCKTKSTRNPLYRWVIGTEGSSVNEFAFSPCGQRLAVVSQDGFLRVFDYSRMELEGCARSYFGGFLCVCWSPDGRYVVVGGEDDLVTVWSYHERRVVARGQGHHSWVSVVAFDPFTTTLSDSRGSQLSVDRTNSSECGGEATNNEQQCNNVDTTCYRLGSVGQDTQLCLWDITEDLLRQPVCSRTRSGTHNASFGSGIINTGGGGASSSTKCSSNNTSTAATSNSIHNRDKESLSVSESNTLNSSHSPPSFTQRLAGLGGRGGGAGAGAAAVCDDPMRLIGTGACPRFDECPLLEPLVCKKIAQERLTALVFREDCFVTACQDGYVYTWTRPPKSGSVAQHIAAASPTNATVIAVGGGGTVV